MSPPPGNLPIHAHRDEITETIAANPVTVIQGDTGSGKSTQLPKFCLAMGRGANGLIGHTQPRRVAARSVAARIAQELGEDLERTVGYQVRFTARMGPETRIKLMSDGILLAQIQGDRRLAAYDTLIIDEVHERNLTIDFLLGYLKQLLPRRPDLKLILASATIDAERFSRHFDDAPVISVSGRTFPVTVRYWPLTDTEAREETGKKNRTPPSLPEAVAEAVRRVVREFPVHGSAVQAASGSGPIPGGAPRGDAFRDDGLRNDALGNDALGNDAVRNDAVRNDAVRLAAHQHPTQHSTDISIVRGATARDILVFLAGEQEIRESAALLTKHPLPGIEVLPLFGRLDAARQDRIFAPHSRRHVVLATNIAETSLTVPGIGFVIDAGAARISRYSHHAKVQRLPVEPISQASANQRKGRCGRVAPGVCIRLYSEEDFAARPAFTEPEIRRTNLATVILRMKSLGFGEIERFPFLDKPERRYIADGLRLLRELGALDKEDRLTRRGRQLARLPLDPRIGRMILAGSEGNCLAEVLVIASALSIPDPRMFSRDGERDTREMAMEARARFQDGRSDFTELLRIWDFYRESRRELSSNRLQKRCRRYFLSYPRMREWHDLHQQLLFQSREMGLPVQNEPASYARLHRALLTGLLGHVGYNSQEKVPDKARARDKDRGREKARDREYTGARNTRFLLGRDSVLYQSRPRWVMAAELVQTSRTYAYTVARIRPEWIERAGKGLIKTTYFDSHWDGSRGEVMAYERLTLYGLTIIAQRRIPYAAVNPEAAREIFLEAALVDATDEGSGEERDGQGSGLLAESSHPARQTPGQTLDRTLGHPSAGGGNASAKTFLAHNRALVAHLREMERRSRRPDAFVTGAALYEFYGRRIPRQVTGARSFHAWRGSLERGSEHAGSGSLFLSPGDLCDPKALARVRGQFPDGIRVRGQQLRLSYRFDPGGRLDSEGSDNEPWDDGKPDDTLDGVTVTVLHGALYQLGPGPFQWLVPGLLEEKIIALLRALPKPLRRTLPPIAETARACFSGLGAEFMPAAQETEANPAADSGTIHITYPDKSLLEALGDRLRSMASRVTISAAVWREDRLPAYLRMNFRVIDDQGKTLRMGRDLEKIQRELAPEADRFLPRLPRDGTHDPEHDPNHNPDHNHGQERSGDFHRDGIGRWDFPDLPPRVEVSLHGTRFLGYPAIVDKGESVSLRLVDSQDRATALSRAGVCRLLMLAMAREIRYLGKNLPDLQRLCLTYATLNGGLNARAPREEKAGNRGGGATNACEALREELVMAIVERTFLDSKAPIRTREAFGRTREKHARDLMTVGNTLCALVGRILEEYRIVASLRAGLDARVSPAGAADIGEQLDRLLFQGFIRATPAGQLPHLPRYLKAIARRIEKLQHAPDKDRRQMEQLRPLQQAHAALVAANLGERNAELDHQRWLLEELRVSLFAQELGTAEPVSAKRLQKLFGQ
ncbi:MAG: ATP-dependent helicase HrpA [Candidatus Kentron sp. G]|nr:MAG: ATP-dependent helicase HrpA [Candidatus Kentron sp. G]